MYVISQANAMNERIGYPEFILNNTELNDIYAGVSESLIWELKIGLLCCDHSCLISGTDSPQLEFDGEQYFENILRVEAYDSLKNLRQLREPVRKDK